MEFLILNKMHNNKSNVCMEQLNFRILINYVDGSKNMAALVWINENCYNRTVHQLNEQKYSICHTGKTVGANMV